jgi:predicted phage terminase large subunit-like protein
MNSNVQEVNTELAKGHLDRETLLMAGRSSAAFGKLFLPEHYTRAFAPIHGSLFRMIDSKEEKTALAAPRGFGKTTNVGLALPLRTICYKLASYICYISCTYGKASEDLDTLKKEITGNEPIYKVFGDLKGDKWTEGIIETTNGVRVVAKGAGNQIRGTKTGHSRPDLVIVDDLEDSEAVRNPDRRNYLKEWFYSDVINSIAPGGRILVIGTILHEDSLLQNLLEDPEWTSMRLELFNDRYESNWPEYKTDNDIRLMIENYKNRGMLDVLYREYRNLPIATEDACFRPEYFKDYEQEWLKDPNVRYVVIIDPAKTIKITADDTAIGCIGVNTAANRIYFVDCVSGKMEPDEIYRNAADMADRWNTPDIAPEVTSLHEFIMQPFKAYLAKRGRYYNLIELKAQGAKPDRIRQLVPYYRQGMVYHNPMPSIKGKLETQLLAFDRGRRDDIIDMFAYILKVFELQNMVFSLGNIPGYDEEEEYKMLLEKEDYIPLPRYQLA